MMKKYIVCACLMALVKVVSADEAYSTITNELNKLLINKNWQLYGQMIIDNKEVCISNGMSRLAIADAYLTVGDASSAYSYAMTTETEAGNPWKYKKYDIAILSATRLKDTDKLYATCTELLTTFDSTETVNEYAFRVLNQALYRLLTLNPKLYDIKATLYIANAKFSLMLLEDKAKWEVFIAKIRLSLEVL